MAHILSHSTAKPQAAAKMTTGRTTKAKSSMTYPTPRYVFTPGADKRDLTCIKSMRILDAGHKIRIRDVDAAGRPAWPGKSQRGLHGSARRLRHAMSLAVARRNGKWIKPGAV